MKNKFWYFFTTLRSIFALFLFRKLLIVSIFTQIPPTGTLKMKYKTLNLGHTLKYDSKTQTILFCIFCTTSAKILVLPHFQTLQIKYSPLKFFPRIPFKNIHFYVLENEKNPNWFFGQFGWFSRTESRIKWKQLYTGFILLSVFTDRVGLFQSHTRILQLTR